MLELKDKPATVVRRGAVLGRCSDYSEAADRESASVARAASGLQVVKRCKPAHTGDGSQTGVGRHTYVLIS